MLLLQRSEHMCKDCTNILEGVGWKIHKAKGKKGVIVCRGGKRYQQTKDPPCSPGQHPRGGAGMDHVGTKSVMRLGCIASDLVASGQYDCFLSEYVGSEEEGEGSSFCSPQAIPMSNVPALNWKAIWLHFCLLSQCTLTVLRTGSITNEQRPGIKLESYTASLFPFFLTHPCCPEDQHRSCSYA